MLCRATLSDHLFLLNHVMRCPAGVGEWAAKFIQPQALSLDMNDEGHGHIFNNPYIDNLLTLLSTMLLKVKGREELLKELRVTRPPPPLPACKEDPDDPQDAIFTVLDSEGEEDVEPWTSWSLLRENDLVQLLTQIPLDDMFRYILRVERRDGRDHYDPRRSSENSFLRLFAFSTTFVYLLKEGLATFNTPRYRQFAKRLGQLIMHTVEYVSDHWAAFKMSKESLAAPGEDIDPALRKRIQVEYDNFFLRATKCIFSSQKLGAWQYLAAIPYSTISMDMLWRIFYVLHLDYAEEHHGDFGAGVSSDWASILDDPDLQIQFEEKLAQAAATESYFLLSAFANMAVSRDAIAEREFVHRSVADIFHAGFVNECTAEHCCKNARDLLANVARKHPSIHSFILALLADDAVLAAVGLRVFGLVKDLPLHSWSPTEEDVELLTGWLSRPLSTLQSQVAQDVLGRMNWNAEHLISWRHHQSVALAVAGAGLRYAPDSIAGGFLEESVKQVSNIAANVVRESPEQAFTRWAWITVSKLRLHACDMEPAVCVGAVRGEAAAFSRVLDFDLSDRVESLVKGVCQVSQSVS